jgi:hypothetical protein
MLRYSFIFLVALPLVAQDGAEAIAILKKNCAGCHNANSVNGGLALDSKEAILKGGNRGPAAPVILAAVKHSGDLKMPKGGKKLADADIAILEKWVQDGMPAPASFGAAKRRSSKHWAFQPVHPKPANASIDSFILAKLQEKGLVLSPRADKRTLLRRVHLDLTGLPPTPAQLEAFLKDDSPTAYEKVVDQLLASPAYGERWGRHWLDVARYSDTDGYTIDAPRDIWPYRDWVLKAINKDMPFDQFVIEQVAGDLLPNPTNDQLIATGFHRNTPSNYEGGIDFEQYRVEAVADRVATTGSAFLGLTLACARCHDHKYDPVTQREFYQIFSFWNGVDEVDKEEDRKYFNRPFLEIGTDEEKARQVKWDADFQALELKIRKHQESLTENADKDPTLIALRKELVDLRKEKPKLLRTLIMKERPAPRESYIHLGGDFTRKGSPVQPGGIAVLPPMPANANRLDFAKWLVAKDNPLTPRVTVNRVWQKYFGRGIVDTESDFGVVGDRPTHPELLDYLAAAFIESGWSQKALHKLIVTSATYQQASLPRPDAAAVDPENKLLARQNRLRLDAEIIRDSALVSSGLLTQQLGGPSFYPPIPPGALTVTQVVREWKTATGAERYRRGMYTFFQRSAAHPSLTVFDAADGITSCTRRIRSNSPLQALTLLNDEASVEFAAALGQRIVKEAPAEDPARLRHGFELAVQRAPRPRETDRLLRFVRQQRDSMPEAGDTAVWTSVARVLLNLDEFMTRE